MSMLLGAVSSVAVAVDEFFNRVTLLLPGNGTNGAQNNTFLDSSTNNFTITRNGNTTQGTFTPFSQTGWSNYFDGTGDYLSIASGMNVGTSDFTIEAWVFPTAWTVAFTSVFSTRPSNSTGGATDVWVLGVNDTGYPYIFSGAFQIQGSAGQVVLNAWTHLAVSRSGSTMRLFVNGTLVQTSTTSQNYTQGAGAIGANRDGSEQWTGYLSNLRLVSGTAVYTSSFTPSTTPLTAITNTSLLTCQSNRFIDNSSNAYTITRNGDVSIQAFSPFAPTAAYSAATVGGSGYFDGTGDYLSNATAAVADFGTGDFTFECWFYLTALSSSSFYQIFSAANTVGAFQVYKTTTSNDIVLDVNGIKTLTLLSGSSLSANSWYHIAVVRSGSGSNNLKTYVNGSQTFQYTDSTNFTVTGAYVGAFATGVSTWPGYIAGLRFLKGTAQAPSGIPTAPPTAITNTVLLLNFTNAGITDATAKNDLETVGNAQISTTQSKFGGGSMLFDGTGDYLTFPSSPNLAFGTGNYTVEAWVYFTSISGAALQIIFRSGGGGNNFYFHVDNDQISVGTGSAFISNQSTTFNTNTWYHIAACRSGTTLRLFRDGTQVGSSVTDNTNWVSTGTAGVGSNETGIQTVSGYIDDLRVSKYARYTSNFTPPTVAFPLQ
jgi:hypothetical protein